MDQSERIAEQHLYFRGYSDVRHEPDGKCPPDFLVDGNIAVEVRRLNQNYFASEPPEGLENAEHWVLDHLTRLFASYGTSRQTRFIGVRFSRPLPPRRKVTKAAHSFLDSVLEGRVPEGTRQTIAENMELEYMFTQAGEGDVFCLGVLDDGDSGGWAFDLLQQNIGLCILEKTRKIEPYRSRYAIWWLFLIDRLVHGLPIRFRERFRQLTTLEHDWDKVVIINSTNPRDYFEL